jgi:hypothetical protein
MDDVEQRDTFDDLLKEEPNQPPRMDVVDDTG